MSTVTATSPPILDPPVAPPKSRIRAEDFLKMDLGEGLHELVDGEIVEVPPPRPKHGSVCVKVTVRFHLYGETTGRGHVLCNDTVVVIDDYNVRGADVQYFSEARWPKAQVGNDPPPVPPDLVVEVVSPSDSSPKVLKKVVAYLEAGVFVVLVLNPADQTVAIYRGNPVNPTLLSGSDTLENLPELPDFRCTVSEFFS